MKLREPRVTRRVALISLAFLTIFLGADSGKEVVKRARLPEFDPAEVSQYFFPDLFGHLVGDRPDRQEMAGPSSHGSWPEPGVPSDDDRWSRIISSTTIADEVKAIKIRLDGIIRGPSGFASGGYRTARRDLSVLAALFAIVADYDSDVRFKRSAATARDRFARASARIDDGDFADYDQAKRSGQDLQDLVGGATLPDDNSTPNTDWSLVADRSSLMQRLEVAFQERLVAWSRSDDVFADNIEGVTHEIELLAAIARILTRDGVDDSDDMDYTRLARRMEDTALEVAAAVKRDDPKAARGAVSRVENACADCHELYR